MKPTPVSAACKVMSSNSSSRLPQQRPLTLLCPTPPPLQPCPLVLLSTAAMSRLAGGDDELYSDPDLPIDYSLKGRMRDRSRSPQSPVAPKKSQLPSPAPALLDAESHERAARAADVIRARLEGHGRRVHLFLGVILHSALPLASGNSEDNAALAEVAVFCDPQRKPVGRPSHHFLVLNTQLLALTWSKFKGNSSSEFSTLTRAIRSSRQKYRGIFESVGTPCKKLYKFGDTAMQEFRHVFSQCYADS